MSIDNASLPRVNTAKNHGLAACPHCHFVNKWDKEEESPKCHRCDGAIYSRKPDSYNRTLAYTITATIAYIPANLLPIMTIVYFGKGDPDTILSGVALLIKLGSYPIAAVIFLASFILPLSKLVALYVLVYSLKNKSRFSKKRLTTFYRFIEIFGRWSLLDVFVVALLVTLVEIGSVVEIIAGGGATAFGIMVVLSILAAESFDPRLIWDEEE
ncbi:paraquat-inducible protein A [Psychromonas sp. MME2]|uniref:paraquat-inducible protein A n=1 Tax=unclassified Psychromonas TaxID=2614957 RepID=UPI00339C75B7